jgi:Ca2+/Na+ antiporter
MMCADVAVARNGQGAMSMAACFGAPVLNDLLGFGN